MKRYGNLDGLRTIAALGIVLMHVRANIGYIIVSGRGTDYIINQLIPQLSSFVCLFFIISGFSMCCGYYERIKNNEITLNSFYGKRYRRILPFFSLLVLMDLAVKLLLEGRLAIYDIYEAFADLTLMFGFLPTSNISVIGVGWTLGVIFGFYILFPFFVFLIWTRKRAWIGFASPFGNECINRIKHSKYKNIVKLLLHKDTNFVERLNSYRGKKKYVLIGVPEYDNLGDIAIGYSEEHFIANHKSEGVELLVVTELNFWKYFKHLKEVISEEDIICIQGGGNFGNQYPDQEKIRRKIISNFNNTIILMPSTFYLIDEEKNAKKYSKFYNRKNITIFAREIYSYNKMKKYFTCNILLCPDIVLSLPIVDFGHERKGIGVCLRNDVESNLTIATKEDIKKQLLSKFPSLSHFDTCIRTPALYANQESILQNCWKDISKYEVVITDKLHAMIFCYITKTPCVVISNYNYKIKGVFEWIKDLGWIQFVDDTSKILEFVESVVSLEKKTAKTDSLFENLSEIFSEE